MPDRSTTWLEHPVRSEPLAALGPWERLLSRLQAIATVLQTDEEALGLLALGSVGQETSRLDAWSDLDFFVLVQAGAKARYIADLQWLDRAHPVAWSFRNTVDGHKALMADGVLCEFAVFSPEELAKVPYSPGRWVWRKDSLAASGAHPVQPLPAPRDGAWLLGEALSNLMVGLMRHARGEKLAAMRMVQVFALDRLLELEALGSPPAAGVSTAAVSTDPFNVDRRMEARHPQLGAHLPLWAGGYGGTVAAALTMLEWLQARHEVSPDVSARIRELATEGQNQLTGSDERQ